MAGKARFQLFVKAGQDGKCVGDCPFSQRASMLSKLKCSPQDIELTPIDTGNKPDYFLKISPEGKVPVLIDRQTNQTIPDSGKIVEYLNELFPLPDLQLNYSGPAVEAASGIFPKFAGMMKNKEESKEAELKDALTEELKKLNVYLESRKEAEGYILCGNVSELDCQVLPKLRHVQVAGSHYKQYTIPAEFLALHQYIKCGEASEAFRSTCPADEQIIWGWSKFFS